MTSNLKTGSLLFYFHLYPEDNSLHKLPSLPVVADRVIVRAAKAAVKKLQQQSSSVSLLVLKTLWPVPEALIRKKAAPFKRLVMVEMNLGQYIREIRRLLPDKKNGFLGQMNGELIKPDQITEVVLNGNAHDGLKIAF